mmetsp:Transcript_16445/g.51427  ORF Transcript_16445/g.51427 Transcript_16445/m.51427 type:complete len:327 (-) Transcript_16445:1785-2765(-)
MGLCKIVVTPIHKMTPITHGTGSASCSVGKTRPVAKTRRDTTKPGILVSCTSRMRRRGSPSELTMSSLMDNEFNWYNEYGSAPCATGSPRAAAGTASKAAASKSQWKAPPRCRRCAFDHSTFSVMLCSAKSTKASSRPSSAATPTMLADTDPIPPAATDCHSHHDLPGSEGSYADSGMGTMYRDLPVSDSTPHHTPRVACATIVGMATASRTDATATYDRNLDDRKSDDRACPPTCAMAAVDRTSPTDSAPTDAYSPAAPKYRAISPRPYPRKMTETTASKMSSENGVMYLTATAASAIASAASATADMAAVSEYRVRNGTPSEVA